MESEPLEEGWTLAVAERDAGPEERWAVCIDPRLSRVTVEPVVVSPTSEIGLMAVFRRYLPGRPPPAALERLAGREAAALLAVIDEGYEATMTWSGDVIGRWSEVAWHAAEELAGALCSEP